MLNIIALRRATLAVLLALFAVCIFTTSAFAAKNVIVMIGDGMGFKHVEAARNYLGSTLTMQTLPVKYAVSTYEYGGSYNSAQAWSNFSYVKSGYTDSASAATALSTGVKANNGNICTDNNDVRRLTNLNEYAKTAGKATGVASTVPFSHATPASFGAHNNYRDNYTAIAREMITSYGDGTGARGNTPTLDVVIGGGHPSYASGFIGTTEYNALKTGTTGQGWSFIERTTGVNGGTSLVTTSQTATKLFGLYGGSGGNIPYRNANGGGANSDNPTLADMTRAALNVEAKNPNGMFLMIEGGAIDWAAHSNNINQMIGEVIGFDQAVKAVMDWVNVNDPSWSDTLLIVTADHETGYLTKGTSVYPNVALGNPGAGILPTAGTHIAWNSTSHTNSLVPLYAMGAGSEMFANYATMYDSGWGMNYLDNTDIFKVAYAATVPEPASLSVLAFGLMAVVARRRNTK